jgi:tRNA A-37 threonylcarbamoyl transferase component Bud32
LNADPLIGTIVAGHRIEELIGQGGMSVVYRATHVRIGRTRALKLLGPQLASDASFRERFEREWRIAAEIEHPNIVDVYDAGEEDGRLYIAMALIQGTDLRSVIDTQSPLEPRRVLGILAQVASALDAAHARGLVHRDIKPANILLAPGDKAYLTDFGVAKHASDSSGMTRTGFFVGTLEYAAPEQLEGRALDARTDVYALGGVLHSALTGVSPYQVDSEMQLFRAHLFDPPPRPSAHRPELPPALDTVVAQAMAKNQEERYATASDLIVAAHRAVSEGTVETLAAPTAPTAPLAAAAATAPTAAAAPPPPPPPTAAAAPPPAWSPAPPPGGGGDSPFSRGTSKTAIAIVAGLVALLLVGVVVGAILLTGGDDDSGRDANPLTPTTTTQETTEETTDEETTEDTTEEATEETTDEETTTEEETGGTGDFPNAEEDELLSHLSDEVRPQCERGEITAEGSTADLQCLALTGSQVAGVFTYYHSFPDEATMNSWYESQREFAGIETGAGECTANTWNGEDVYTIGEEEVGRFLCYESDSLGPEIYWTDTRFTYGGEAFHESERPGRLLSAWQCCL